MMVPRFTGRRWDAAQLTARKAARVATRLAHGTGQNIPALRDRLDSLTTALGY